MWGERNKQILERMRFSAPVKAGPHLVQVYFAAKTSAYVEDLFDPSLRRDPYRASGEPAISSVTITGPRPETASVGDEAQRVKTSPTRRYESFLLIMSSLLFFCETKKPILSSDDNSQSG